MTKRKIRLWVLAGLSLAAGLLLCMLEERQLIWLFAIPAWPVAAGLRQLSLMGGGWNVLAWGLYVGISLVPAVYLLLRVVKKRAHGCDGLLAVLSGLLLWVLYWLINPSAMGSFFGSRTGLSPVILGVLLWSAAICYLLLRLCDRVAAQGEQGLHRWLARLVWVLIALCFADLFAVGLPHLVREIRAGGGLSFVDLMAKAITHSIAIRTCLYALDLIGRLEQGWYTPETAEAAEALAEACAQAIVVTALTRLLRTLMQVALSSVMADVHFSLDVPVGQILLLLSVMLLARMIARGKTLQDDSDSII